MQIELAKGLQLKGHPGSWKGWQGLRGVSHQFNEAIKRFFSILDICQSLGGAREIKNLWNLKIGKFLMGYQETPPEAHRFIEKYIWLLCFWTLRGW